MLRAVTQSYSAPDISSNLVDSVMCDNVEQKACFHSVSLCSLFREPHIFLADVEVKLTQRTIRCKDLNFYKKYNSGELYFEG